jgi:uncharacterized membrane protein
MNTNKRISDVLKSRRFVSFAVYIVVNLLAIPLLKFYFPNFSQYVNAYLFTEHSTEIVMLLIAGYSLQDAVSAYVSKVDIKKVLEFLVNYDDSGSEEDAPVD